MACQETVANCSRSHSAIHTGEKKKSEITLNRFLSDHLRMCSQAFTVCRSLAAKSCFQSLNRSNCSRIVARLLWNLEVKVKWMYTHVRPIQSHGSMEGPRNLGAYPFFWEMRQSRKAWMAAIKIFWFTGNVFTADCSLHWVIIMVIRSDMTTQVSPNYTSAKSFFHRKLAILLNEHIAEGSNRTAEECRRKIKRLKSEFMTSSQTRLQPVAVWTAQFDLEWFWPDVYYEVWTNQAYRPLSRSRLRSLWLETGCKRVAVWRRAKYHPNLAQLTFLTKHIIITAHCHSLQVHHLLTLLCDRWAICVFLPDLRFACASNWWTNYKSLVQDTFTYSKHFHLLTQLGPISGLVGCSKTAVRT